MAERRRGNSAKPVANRIPSSIVHSIFVTSSSVAVSCALIALGATCYVMGNAKDSGPCPKNLQAAVFGLGGGLLIISFFLFIRIYRSRKRNFKKSQLDDIIGKVDGRVAEESMVARNDHAVVPTAETAGVTADEAPVNSANDCTEMDKFIMEQKSADVSYWIQHQESPVDDLPAPPELPEAAIPDREPDVNSTKSETTAL